ncbi:MAG TPA: hypothetical protein VMA72_18040 [Streptosporangiaceae bacterium]|nr:hypothetical protein [Streptosporangiaceae bacterium]
MKLIGWLRDRMSRLTQLLSIGSDAESDASIAHAADRGRRSIGISVARDSASAFRRQ